MEYRDFDLLIERAAQGYRAQVLNSPAGQATADFVLPFSDLELENFLLRLGRPVRTVRRLESTEMSTAKSFGEALFNAVFSGDVRACLRSSVDEAKRDNAGIRVRLRLADPALADLPWEFLYVKSVNRFLALSVQTPLIRYMDLPEVVQPIAVTPPIRVLVMISSPTDYPSLDVEAEWQRLNEALGDLIKAGTLLLERMEEATLAALQRRLRRSQYHIFHFIGHGEFDQTLQEGVLLLEREKQRGHRVGSQYLGMLLHDHESLRIAVLNACEGARTSKQDPFAGSAQTLVQQGIPAVIAMQFEIADDVAQHLRARALRRAGRRLPDRRGGDGSAEGDFRDGPRSRVGDAGALSSRAGRPDLRRGPQCSGDAGRDRGPTRPRGRSAPLGRDDPD